MSLRSSTTPHVPSHKQPLFTSKSLPVYCAKHAFIGIAFIMTRRFWSLKHKSDVMQWDHGAWRLLTSSSKIRLWCKKTSKCVRCQINSFLKDMYTHTQRREQMPFIDDSSWFWKYDTPSVCFFSSRIIACCSCYVFFLFRNWQLDCAYPHVPRVEGNICLYEKTLVSKCSQGSTAQSQLHSMCNRRNRGSICWYPH